MDASPTPPDACPIAFKEWAGVCRALASGRQSIILRKGGIEEGPGGFAPEHPAFWLYPTFVHEADQGLRVDSEASPPTPGVVAIDALAAVERVERIDRLEDLEALAPLHVWTAETVAKRFAYRRPGLWALGVRVHRLPAPHLVEITPAQLGCKTWVPLDEPLSGANLIPVLTDAEAAAARAALGEALAGRGARPIA